MTQKVGLVGLGNAGLALATPIARKFTVVAYDRDEARRKLAQAVGVEVASDARAVAEQCSILMLCLPNPEISRTVLAEIGTAALDSKLIIENSTVGPDDIDALLRIAAPAKARIMGAAILGGVHKLTAGKGTFLVGAADADFAEAKPILESASEKIFHLGPLGNGMRAKLVCNGVAHAVMVVLIEAAALAAAQGIPMETFYELMRRDSGLTRPLTHRFFERILKQDFEGGMTIANAHKDSALILDVARSLGVPLFATAAAHTPYEIALGEEKKSGRAPQDYASISKLWEKWAGVSFGAK
jgi:3-hydroxyisobutyrate dehydrogenase-like beta-hydroxyacid dehydrogenase